jgi:hypothetical protein
MNVQEVISLVQGVGFPVLVAWFVLVRLEKTLKELINVVQDLNKAVGQLVVKGT